MIAGSIADHQHSVLAVAADVPGFFERFFLRADFLTADGSHVFCNILLRPLPLQCFLRRGGHDQYVGLALHFFQRIPDKRKRRHALIDDRIDLPVDGQGPFERLFHHGVRMAFDFGDQRRIAQFGLLRNPVDELLRFRNLHISCLHFRSATQPIQRFDQSRKAVDAPAFRVQIDKFKRFPGIFAHALKVPILDGHRHKAFFVLEFHRVKSAAVGVNADEKFVLGRVFELHNDTELRAGA